MSTTPYFEAYILYDFEDFPFMASLLPSFKLSIYATYMVIGLYYVVQNSVNLLLYAVISINFKRC